jgi:hypothetical protein
VLGITDLTDPAGLASNATSGRDRQANLFTLPLCSRWRLVAGAVEAGRGTAGAGWTLATEGESKGAAGSGNISPTVQSPLSRSLLAISIH